MLQGTLLHCDTAVQGKLHDPSQVLRTLFMHGSSMTGTAGSAGLAVDMISASPEVYLYMLASNGWTKLFISTPGPQNASRDDAVTFECIELL